MGQPSRPPSTHFLPHTDTSLFSLVLLAGVIFIYGCHPDCNPESWSLNGGSVHYTPEKDSLRVGDTLWVDMQLPGRYPVDSSKTVDITGGSNVLTILNVHAIPKFDTSTFAVDSFSYIPVIGNVARQKTGDASVDVTFQGTGEGYGCRFGMIARKKGLYVLTIIDMYEIRKKCFKASVEVLVDNKDPNLYILDQMYNPTSPYEPEVPAFELTHDYCFRVN